MTLPVGVIAGVVAIPTLVVKALRRLPVTQQIALDEMGVHLSAGERESALPWAAFSGIERLAGCVLLRGERGDVLLLAHRLSAEQRVGLEALLATAFTRDVDAAAPAQGGEA
jgi:uncharacterized membrane protein